jgi:hypothetical protein
VLSSACVPRCTNLTPGEPHKPSRVARAPALSLTFDPQSLCASLKNYPDALDRLVRARYLATGSFKTAVQRRDVLNDSCANSRTLLIGHRPEGVLHRARKATLLKACMGHEAV